MKGNHGDRLVIAGETIDPGETRDLHLAVSESFSGASVSIPLRVIRGKQAGPVLLVTAAVHGDELNGTGAIRELMLDPHQPDLIAGSLVLVPVVNILGFERKARYLPDRRDLNRNFPGSTEGSLAHRFADRVFRGLVNVCDCCIDIHTAAVHRTNFPNVRGDLANPFVDRMARAFGCSLVIHHEGPKGSLRRSATEAGHPTILLEAGEIWKIEASVMEHTLRGIRNVLIDLGMVEGRHEEPAYLAISEETSWLRADTGGILRFFVGPGDLVEKDQQIAQCTSLLGAELSRVLSPADAVISSCTTLPTVKPGDPICQLAIPIDGINRIRTALSSLPDNSLHDRIREDLATGVAPGEIEAFPSSE